MGDIPGNPMKPKSSGGGKTRQGAVKRPQKGGRKVDTSVSDGALSDGTLLFGPFREPPVNHEQVVAVAVGGVTWFAAHSGERIPFEVRPELKRWVRTRVAYFERIKNS